MIAIYWVSLLALGMLCGALGRVIRVVAGLKKLSHEAGGMDGMRTAFVPSQLAISILIGTTAGALASLGLSVHPSKVNELIITTLLGAGYAGVDFIEAFMKKASVK